MMSNVMERCERMIGILGNIGYECDTAQCGSDVKIFLTDPVTQTSYDFVATKETADLLQCLAATNKLKTTSAENANMDAPVARIEDLERRVRVLEERAGITTGTGSTKQAALPSLDELQDRAIAIGTSIYAYDCNYSYYRPRFLIPGTSYKFYFVVANALEPRRKHYSSGYIFKEEEYSLLVKWVKHDEQLYAKLNEQYGVKK